MLPPDYTALIIRFFRFVFFFVFFFSLKDDQRQYDNWTQNWTGLLFSESALKRLNGLLTQTIWFGRVRWGGNVLNTVCVTKHFKSATHKALGVIRNDRFRQSPAGTHDSEHFYRGLSRRWTQREHLHPLRERVDHDQKHIPIDGTTEINVNTLPRSRRPDPRMQRWVGLAVTLRLTHVTFSHRLYDLAVYPGPPYVHACERFASALSIVTLMQQIQYSFTALRRNDYSRSPHYTAVLQAKLSDPRSVGPKILMQISVELWKAVLNKLIHSGQCWVSGGPLTDLVRRDRWWVQKL